MRRNARLCNGPDGELAKVEQLLQMANRRLTKRARQHIRVQSYGHLCHSASRPIKRAQRALGRESPIRSVAHCTALYIFLLALAQIYSHV